MNCRFGSFFHDQARKKKAAMNRRIPKLSGRPVQRSAAEEMKVQVVDRLAAVASAIEDHSITVTQPQLLGDLSGDEQ